MAPSVSIPKSVLQNAGNESATLRKYLTKALDNALEPVNPEGMDVIHSQVVLTNALKSRLSEIGSKYPDMTLYQLVSRLITAQYILETKKPKIKTKKEIIIKKTLENYLDISDELLTGNGFCSQKPRKDQKELLASFLQHYSEHQQKEAITLLSEAGTGIGKSRILISFAHYIASKTKEVVLLCAPTKNLIRQLVNEYSQVFDPQDQLPVSVVFGRNEYISEQTLSSWYLQNPDDPNSKAVKQWLNEQEVQHYNLMPGFLAESLMESVPDFDCTDFRLTPYDTSENDLGALTYESHLYSKDSKIIIASHAMVAIDVRKRLYESRVARISWDEYENIRAEALNKNKKALPKFIFDNQEQLKFEKGEGDLGILPDYGYLLVDEAHQLRESFQSVFTDRVSIRYLSNLLDKVINKKTIKNEINRIKHVSDQLQSLGRGHNSMTLSVRNNESNIQSIIDELFYELSESCKRVHSFLSKSKDNKIKNLLPLREIQNTLSILGKMSNNQYNYSQSIQFSSVRRSPSISLDIQDVSGYLDYLWKRVNLSALFSATLYVHSKEDFFEGYTKNKLSINTELYALKPVESDWLFTPVTCYVPQVQKVTNSIKNHRGKMDDRYYLEPPTMSRISNAQLQKYQEIWSNEVSEVIGRVTENSKGGSLVLCASYDDLDTLEKKLSNSIIKDRIISTRTGGMFFEHLRLYKKQYEEGAAPIWLSTGRAWTGLDLTSSSPAKDDYLLQNLIIPKIPIAPPNNGDDNNSTFSVTDMVNETYFKVRQGIGRLVRRRNVPPKNLYILDARLHHKRNKNIMRPIKTLLGKYRPWVELLERDCSPPD